MAFNNFTRIKRMAEGISLFRAIRSGLMLALLFGGISLSAFSQDAAAPAPAPDAAAAPAASAAEGEKIFKENCQSCHKIDKDMTGPALMGVESRVPNKQWLYSWIRNSPGVIASGDKYATDLFAKWNKVPMTAFPNFTDQQIDAVLAYIASYKAPDVAVITAEPIDNNPQFKSLWGWARLLILVVVLLLLNIAVLVTRLRGVEFLKGINLQAWNAWTWPIFYLLGMGGTLWLIMKYKHLFHLVTNPASEHGVEIDFMFWLTMAVAFTVYVLVNALLFYFAWKYGKDGERKATYYPENHKLELLWPVVPAVVLTVLIAFGIKTWNKIMVKDPDKSAYNIELNAQQFAWNIHYPGVDNKLGDVSVHNISGNNLLGVDFSAAESHDDFMANEIYLPKGKPVTLTIRSRDVIHSVHMPHFRVKMDAVPGMKTRFTFTATKTTAEARAEKGDENFNFELACAEVCGRGHFSMQKKIVVVEEAVYQEWIKLQPKMFDPKVHAVNTVMKQEQHASADNGLKVQ